MNKCCIRAGILLLALLLVTVSCAPAPAPTAPPPTLTPAPPAPTPVPPMATTLPATPTPLPSPAATPLPPTATAAPPTITPLPSPTRGPIAFVGKLVGEPEPFDTLSGLALDKQGNLFVFDIGAARVFKYGPDAKRIAQWGSRGTGDGQFARPVHGLGNLAWTAKAMSM